jgi:hypothetical protein
MRWEIVMTLAETVLQKVAEWRPAGTSERHRLAIPDDASGWTVSLAADRSDELGCLLWEVTLHRTRPPAAAQTLKSCADAVARRVTGLLEKLQVVEVDPPRGEALLRSDQPLRRKDGLFYYELLLRDTCDATLRRYKVPADGSRREQVTFALTHESLAKLVQDVTTE